MIDKNIDEVGPWVDVVFIEDWDDAIEESEKKVEFGDWNAMAEYMSAWDFGDESDHDIEPVATWGQNDLVFPVTVNGMNYMISANWDMRYACLSRRPINN